MKEPRFKLRDKVVLTIEAAVTSDLKIKQDVEFFVCGIKISSNSIGQTILYDVCTSLPDAYFPGKGFQYGLEEDKLR